jgi:hypothetical protein
MVVLSNTRSILHRTERVQTIMKREKKKEGKQNRMGPDSSSKWCDSIVIIHIIIIIIITALQPFVGPWPLFQFLDPIHNRSSNWTADQPVARPLPVHRTKTRKNAHNTDIHALSGIRTHDPCFRASEDSPCSGPRGPVVGVILLCRQKM